MLIQGTRAFPVATLAAQQLQLLTRADIQLLLSDNQPLLCHCHRSCVHTGPPAPKRQGVCQPHPCRLHDTRVDMRSTVQLQNQSIQRGAQGGMQVGSPDAGGRAPELRASALRVVRLSVHLSASPDPQALVAAGLAGALTTLLQHPAVSSLAALAPAAVGAACRPCQHSRLSCGCVLMQFEGAAALRCGPVVWHQWQRQVHTGIHPGGCLGQIRTQRQYACCQLARGECRRYSCSSALAGCLA